MLPTSVAERRNAIIEILNEKGRVSVKELSALFSVSSVIIRTDLEELEKQDMLTRIHGGAKTSYKSYYDMGTVQRSNTNAEEKEAIAQRISKMVKDNSTIILNAGTTPLFVMRAIKDKKVTILTNSIALALEGASNPNFRIILLGGDVDSNYQFTYGVSVLSNLEQYTADLFILSVDGVDATHGISTFYHAEAEICRSMIKHARKTVVAADYSKIGRTAFAKIGALSSVNCIVTNKKAPALCLKDFKTKGVEVITVN